MPLRVCLQQPRGRVAISVPEATEFTFWDVDAFRAYCDALARAKEARDLVDAHGLLVPGRGGLVTNPASRIERDSVRLAMQIGARFGLSPSDRAGLPGGKRSKDGLAEFTS